MSFQPDFPPAMPGETDFYTVSFANRLASGETILSVEAGLQVWSASPATDPNASGLLIGSPFVTGSTVTAICGGAFTQGSAGFQPTVVYTLWYQVTTSNGRTLEAAGNIATQPYAPPPFSFARLAVLGNEFNEAQNFTPSRTGTYYLTASGLTLTVPRIGVGGDIEVIDRTGAPNLTISGALLNAPPGLSPITAGNIAFTLRWSALYSGFFILGI